MKLDDQLIDENFSCSLKSAHVRFKTGYKDSKMFKRSPLEMFCSRTDLGVLIDSKLKFHSYIRDVIKKNSSITSNLLRVIVCLTLLFIVFSFVSDVRSLFNFGSPIWFTGSVVDLRLLDFLITMSLDEKGFRQFPLFYFNHIASLNLLSISRVDFLKVTLFIILKFSNVYYLSNKITFCF